MFEACLVLKLQCLGGTSSPHWWTCNRGFWSTAVDNDILDIIGKPPWTKMAVCLIIVHVEKIMTFLHTIDIKKIFKGRIVCSLEKILHSFHIYLLFCLIFVETDVYALFKKSCQKKCNLNVQIEGCRRFFLTMIKDPILAWGGFLIASRCLSSRHFKSWLV